MFQHGGGEIEDAWTYSMGIPGLFWLRLFITFFARWDTKIPLERVE